MHGYWRRLLRRGQRRGREAFLVAAAALCACAVAGPVQANSAQLTLGAAAVTFTVGDPDSAPTVAALENPVSIRAMCRGSTTGISALTVQAMGDLESGSDRIPISSVFWVASGPGYLSGAFSTVPQLVGQWSGPSDSYGSLRFWFANSWDWMPGAYSQSVVYTLVSY